MDKKKKSVQKSSRNVIWACNFSIKGDVQRLIIFPSLADLYIA